MTASRLADAPNDAPALEQELWRSVSRPAPQSAPGPSHPLMPERPLSAGLNRPLPAPANQSVPPAALKPARMPPAAALPAAPAQAAAQSSPSQPAAPRRPANDGVAAPQRRYDWNARGVPAEEPAATESSIVEKAVGIYASLARQATRLAGISTPRRWAVGVAGAAVAAVLGAATVGMTLFLDAPRDVEKPVVQAAAAETVAAPASQATDQQALTPQPAAPAKEPTAAIPASVVVTHDASAVPANAAAALLQPQASAPAAVASMQTLETGDARWARNDQATPAQADQQENASAPRQELAQNDGTDSATTSGIVPIKPADAQNVLADEQPAEPAAAQPVAADGGNGSSAVTTVAVKMRAKESNDAKVIAVLPARAPVDVLGCKAWCKVSYKGQEGFIYKRFVQR